MSNFACVINKIDQYNVIVIAKSYEAPFRYLELICKELSEHNVGKCKVIFDLLLCMGNSSERYAEAVFNGKEFDRDSFQYIDVLKKNYIRQYSTEFFKKNSSLLEYSILTSTQKNMLMNGMTI